MGIYADYLDRKFGFEDLVKERLFVDLSTAI